MSMLWPQGINHNKMLLFATDTCSYMLKAAKQLKMSYPRMIHITCMAHKNSMKCPHFHRHLSASLFSSRDTASTSPSMVNAW